ncbi:MAG: hypothetical protein KBD90_03010 [Alphaproteobacteria bacterium]|nr:hypothetical protein [Alphaproteobacteria bacterium]
MFLSHKKYLSFSSLVVISSFLAAPSLRAMEAEDNKSKSCFGIPNKKSFSEIKFAAAKKKVSPIKIKGPLKNATKIYISEGGELCSLDYDETRGRHLKVNTHNKEYLLPTVVCLNLGKERQELDLFLQVLKKSPNLNIGTPLLHKILSHDLIKESIIKTEDFRHIKNKIKAIGPKKLVELLYEASEPYASKVNFAEKSAHFLKDIYKDYEKEIEPYLLDLRIGIPLCDKLRTLLMKDTYFSKMSRKLWNIKEGISSTSMRRLSGCLWEMSPQYASQIDFEKKSIQFLKNTYMDSGKQFIEEFTKPYLVEYSDESSAVYIHISPKIINTYLPEALKSIQKILSENKKTNELTINLYTEKFNREDFALFFQFAQIDNLILQLHDDSRGSSLEFPYEILKENKNIKKFTAYDVRLENEQIKTLADALKQNKTLEELFLLKGKIRDKGVVLAEALKHNTTLKKLDLEHNMLSNESVKALGDALKYNSCLKELFLFDVIKPDGTQYLINSLKYNKSLQTLWMKGDINLFDNAVSQKIVNTLIKYDKVFSPGALNLDASAAAKLESYYFYDKLGKVFIPAPLYLFIKNSFILWNDLQDAFRT